MRNPSKASRAARLLAATIVALALGSLAWAQDATNAPAVGDSIRKDAVNQTAPQSAPPAPAVSEDSGDDSINVTGGVPGAPPSTPSSDTSQAQPATAPSEPPPAMATAPSEAPSAVPPVAIAPPPVEAPAPAAPPPAEVSAPAAPAPAVANAPAPAGVSAPDVPITAADAAPGGAPSPAVLPIEPLPETPAVAAAPPTFAAPAVAVAPAPAPPPAVAPAAPAVAIAPPPAAPAPAAETPPVTTAVAVPPSAVAPPMMLTVPPPAEAAPAEPAPPANAAAAAPASAPAPQEAAAPHKAPKAATGGETKLASNQPQPQGGAFAGMEFGNSKAPIHISSTSMSLDYQNHSVLWTGNVHATQADATLTSNQLRVNYLDKDFKQMKDMVADGNVRLSQGKRWATGQHGVMDQTKRTVVLTGSPVAHDGNDQITGCKITVYLNTNQSVVDCAHAVIFPHSDEAPAAGAAPGDTAEQ